jgi:hypothetical protein
VRVGFKRTERNPVAGSVRQRHDYDGASKEPRRILRLKSTCHMENRRCKRSRRRQLPVCQLQRAADRH